MTNRGHVVSIVGARPQFVKAAVVSRAFREVNVRETLIHTGQHHDSTMSQVFFEELELPPPQRHLGIFDLSHGAMTGRMLEAIEAVLVELEPSVVVIYGDTNSTLAGALAAAKLHIPVAHVESGMRSFNRRMPEELNRIVADHLSALHLVTSEVPRQNLAREGIVEGVHVVGDVMLDAALLYRASATRQCMRERLDLRDRPFGLVTLHRAENTDDPDRLASVVSALGEVSRELHMVFPVHPRTRKMLATHEIQLPSSIQETAPLSYFEMLNLELESTIVFTDSGGVQKEALYAGVPCVTLRDETEWVETVELGWNVLAGTDHERIIRAAARMLEKFRSRSAPPHIYGDGNAGIRIASAVRELS